MKGNVCQSCGMPMGTTDELYGTEKDGTKNQEYCKYCYANGAFTTECTMEEMAEICVKPMVESSEGMTEDVARSMMQHVLPTLKRWKA
ncbi:MAG: zinc ribbon domain-containing protein [Eubacteriales bacterium]